MKRTKLFLSAILAGVLSCFCLLFSGCFLLPAPTIHGTYKFQSMSYKQNGVEINIKVGEEFMGMMTLSEDFMVITLNEDGTAILTTAEMDVRESEEGTWKETGEENKIEITFENDPQICECDGKTLTIKDEDSAIIVLAKA